MDVIANNIANVNTVGYKSSRAVFQDVFSQTSRSAGAPGAQYGGTNPMQIGLGVKTAAIDVLHTQSAFQRTDNPLDLAIQGDGFFVIKSGANELYTRAGNFYLDNAGNLVTSDGSYVQGVQVCTLGSTGGTTSLNTAPTGVISYAVTNLNLSNFRGISIDSNGAVWGLDHSDNKVQIATLAIGTFVNPSGLEKLGSSTYDVTPNSGAVTYNVARTGAAGSVEAGGVEMSNVDLSAEFTDMIVTQRGFQANSRIITTTDTLLEELINLKR
jgi:flagellar hook protein FlgE